MKPFSRSSTRPWSPRKLRWTLRFYPPWFYQNCRVLSWSPDHLHVVVRLKRSLWTRNLNGSTFGGSIYAAADPIFPLMYWQALALRGWQLQAWLRAARIDFLRPAEGDLRFEFRLRPEDLDAAEADLRTRGRTARTDRVQGVDREGGLCAEVELVSFLRTLRPGDREVSGF